MAVLDDEIDEDCLEGFLEMNDSFKLIFPPMGELYSILYQKLRKIEQKKRPTIKWTYNKSTQRYVYESDKKFCFLIFDIEDNNNPIIYEYKNKIEGWLNSKQYSVNWTGLRTHLYTKEIDNDFVKSWLKRLNTYVNPTIFRWEILVDDINDNTSNGDIKIIAGIRINGSPLKLIHAPIINIAFKGALLLTKTELEKDDEIENGERVIVTKIRKIESLKKDWEGGLVYIYDEIKEEYVGQHPFSNEEVSFKRPKKFVLELVNYKK